MENIRINNLKQVSNLIDSLSKSELNTKDFFGVSPLIQACKCESKKIVEMLIKKGVEINIRDNDRNTALIIACKNGYQEIAETLIDANADLNIQNDYGITALTMACLKGYSQIAEMLIKADANPNIQSDSGYNPLIWSCNDNNKNIAQMLIDAGANINIQTKYGDTTLIGACHKGYLEIAAMLINAHADINVKDNAGKDALYYSQFNSAISFLLRTTQEKIFSNCYCSYMICNDCKIQFIELPILKSDNSQLDRYKIKIKSLIKKNLITKKIANKILDELIEFNDEESIKFKNRLRLLDYAKCIECDKLICRECKLNCNIIN